MNVQPVEGFGRLYGINDHLDEMKGQEVETIFCKILAKSRDNHLENKKNFFKGLYIDQDDLGRTNERKADAHLTYAGPLFQTAGVVCGIGAAFLGGGGANPSITGAILNQVGQAFSATDSRYKQSIDANVTRYEHTYNRKNSIVGEVRESVRKSDQAIDADTHKIDQLIQAEQRKVELLVSSSS